MNLGKTDIYLLDQIMKGRYRATDKILDAGCGDGRNMQWFLENKIEIVGIDQNEKAISQLKINNPNLAETGLYVGQIEKTAFPENHFDHVICSAVLHFASSADHFRAMLEEIVRITRKQGSVFIRMASNICMEDKVIPLGDGIYAIPDGSNRFLLTKTLLAESMKEYDLSFIEPLKTVNVNDIRCMSTLVLKKN